MNRINRRLDAADDALRAALLRWRAPGWLPGALTLAAFFLLMMTRTLAQLAGLPLAERAAGVLALCAAASLGRRDERVAVLMLALIALTLFETLFEARARYLFIFAPLYITLAVCGVQALADRRTARKRS